jgi:1-acyl-sn-glycerol-3-phosphate acyltransferase
VELRSVLKVIGIGMNTALLAPLVVAVAAFDEDRAYRLCQLWVRINLLLCGIRVHARREAALDPRTPYVFMSNHATHVDVLAVVAALPEFQLRWVAKRELTEVPVFGWALRHAGHVIVDRSNHEQAMRSLRAAEEKMARGVSVMIFPEGTRGSGGGAMLPFKRGGFVLAAETGAAIVPIAIAGSTRVLARRDWRIHGGDVDVLVGAPIAAAGAEHDALMGTVRARLEGMLGTAPAPERAPMPMAGVR